MYCLIYSEIITYIDKYMTKHNGSHFCLKGRAAEPQLHTALAKLPADFSTSSDLSSIWMYPKCVHGVKATLMSMVEGAKFESMIFYTTLR